MDPDMINENWHRRIGQEPLGQIFFTGYAAHWCRARRITLSEIYNGPEHKSVLNLAMDNLILQAIKVKNIFLKMNLQVRKSKINNSELGCGPLVDHGPLGHT